MKFNLPVKNTFFFFSVQLKVMKVLSYKNNRLDSVTQLTITIKMNQQL